MGAARGRDEEARAEPAQGAKGGLETIIILVPELIAAVLAAEDDGDDRVRESGDVRRQLAPQPVEACPGGPAAIRQRTEPPLADALSGILP